MISCKRCGRKFKNKEALGGHMTRAHASEPANNPSTAPQAPASQVVAPPVEAQPQAAPVAVVVPGTTPAPTPSQPQAPPAAASAPEVIAPSPKPESERQPEPTEGESEAEQIRRYWAKGYRYEKLRQMGFKPSTIRQEVEKLLPPDEPPESSEAKERYDLPMVRKVGGGVEVVNPEILLRQSMNGGEDDEKELRGMMKMRAAMLMVMDLLQLQDKQAEVYAKSVDPVLKLMKETREQQDAAAVRARGSGQEIAQTAAREAAEETAKQVVQYLAEKKPDIASVANPIQGVMARAMETTLAPMLQNLLAGLFVRQPGQAPGAGGGAPAPNAPPAPQVPAAGSRLPPGWEDKGTVEGSV